MSIREIRVPKEIVSDDVVLVLEWKFDSGSKIEKGDTIVHIETSKAVIEIEVDVGGYLFYWNNVGDQVHVGDIVAVISGEEKFDVDTYVSSIKKLEIEETAIPNLRANETRFSKAAMKLIQEHGLSVDHFSKLDLVTKRDVLSRISPNLDSISSSNENTGRRNNIIIVGGGGHSKICIDILRQMKTYSIVGIVDDNLPKDINVLGIPVLGSLDILPNLFDSKKITHAIIGMGAIGNHPFRSELYNRVIEYGFTIPNIIHPSAIIEPSATIGEGNQIMAGAIVGSNAKIGRNCIINAGSITSHDCVLGDNVHLAPSAILAGNVTIENDVLVGMGSTIYLGVTIGSKAIILNGQNVFRNVMQGEIFGK